ncbi:MAG: hypothetical protein Q8S13_04595 [Dehalococcoidia bacterium]|nr:hypothetical protein [Dehalococcoidia bacterium]
MLGGLRRVREAAWLSGMLDRWPHGTGSGFLGLLLVGFGRSQPDDPHRVIDPERATAFAKAAVGAYFTGATIVPTRGLWGRSEEPGVAILVFMPRKVPENRDEAIDRFSNRPRCVARDIAKGLRQDGVLVVMRDDAGRLAHSLVGAAPRDLPDRACRLNPGERHALRRATPRVA